MQGSRSNTCRGVALPERAAAVVIGCPTSPSLTNAVPNAVVRTTRAGPCGYGLHSFQPSPLQRSTNRKPKTAPMAACATDGGRTRGTHRRSGSTASTHRVPTILTLPFTSVTASSYFPISSLLSRLTRRVRCEVVHGRPESEHRGRRLRRGELRQVRTHPTSHHRNFRDRRGSSRSPVLGDE